MKTIILFAALALVTAMTPAAACDYHATQTTAAQSTTVVACGGGKCEAQVPTAQQRSGNTEAH
jgi:Skp family chaperone for outer membrane proteins